MDQSEIDDLEADGMQDFLESEAVRLHKKLNVTGIQIFVTRVEDAFLKTERSRMCTSGSGNWYARYGTVKSWILRCENESKKNI